MQLTFATATLSPSGDVCSDSVFPESATPQVRFGQIGSRRTVEIPHAADTTYLSHGYFRYIGKYPPQLVSDVLNRYEVKGDVLDPMCGGGTTLTEAVLRGINATGIDVNPVSRAVSRLVSAPLPLEKLEDAVADVTRQLEWSGDASVARKADKSLSVNQNPLCLTYFEEKTRCEISRYLRIIEGVDGEVRLAFDVALFAVLRHVSRANIKKMNLEIDEKKKILPFIPTIISKLRDIASRNRLFTQWAKSGNVSVLEGSAESTGLPDQSFDAVFLHPPYLTNTAFCEFTQLQLATIGIDHKSIWKKELRCRGSFLHEPNGLKKYLTGWAKIIEESGRVLKPGGLLITVVGDGQIDYVRIPVGTITREFAADYAFEHVESYFHVLNNHTGQTQSRKMKGQHVSVFRRGAVQ